MYYYTYIAECSDGTLYTGYTNDVKKRIKAHNEGKGAKYTKGRGPVVLKYSEKFEKKEDALKRERDIKKLNKQKKLRIIGEWESKKE